MGAETHIDVNVNMRYCRPTLTNIWKQHLNLLSHVCVSPQYQT